MLAGYPQCSGKRKTSLTIDSCHKSPQAGGRPPCGYPHSFLFPSLFAHILAVTGIFSASWLAQELLDCTWQAWKPCSGPILRLKKELNDSDRHQWFSRWGMLHVKQSWSYTSLCSIDNEQDTASVFPDQGRSRLWFRSRTDVSLAHQLTGKPAYGLCCSWPLRLMTLEGRYFLFSFFFRCFLLIN